MCERHMQAIVDRVSLLQALRQAAQLITWLFCNGQACRVITLLREEKESGMRVGCSKLQVGIGWETLDGEWLTSTRDLPAGFRCGNEDVLSDEGLQKLIALCESSTGKWIALDDLKASTPRDVLEELSDHGPWVEERMKKYVPEAITP